MTPGTYCVPRNRQEWEAILRLADSLGLLWKPFDELVLGEDVFESTKAVVWGTGVVMPTTASLCDGFVNLYSPDFIREMYSERNRQDREADLKDAYDAQRRREELARVVKNLNAITARGPVNKDGKRWSNEDQATFLADKARPSLGFDGTEPEAIEFAEGRIPMGHDPSDIPKPRRSIRNPIPDNILAEVTKVYKESFESQLLLKRLENLEKAFDLHLQEHRKKRFVVVE